ncbi:MAG: caspase family protein [Verrucomicrobia bacterium]|nr:caspase family protein [Verrucomicrobiota bacterium]
MIGCWHPPELMAETRRALLIGINEYAPSASVTSPLATGRGSFGDLHGCVNDAEALHDVLVARFNFEPANIHTLLNADATRQKILAEIQSELIDQAAPGDVCVFFYAGHGSLIRNLKTTKPSGMDSTLVPADSSAGVIDIRDKELARLFNKAIDKGVTLTAIFDSCHSGSIARGLPVTVTSRQLAPGPWVVSDPPDPGETPEERGALVLSAAQDFETAAEATDDNSVPHGAFTIALLKALASASPGIPAADLFQRVQVLLHAEGAVQTPVMAGTVERRNKTLFGTGTGDDAGHIVVTLKFCDFDSGEITLGGGHAIGLETGCELQRLTGVGKDSNQPPVVLRVTSVNGLSQSTARAVTGSFKQVRTGDLFKVIRWTYPTAASLRVWLPVSDLTVENLQRLAPELAGLRSSDLIQWVDDPTEVTPDNVLSWSPAGWMLSGIGSLGKKLQAQDVIHRIVTPSKTKPKLFVSLPVTRELVRQMGLGEGFMTNAIHLAATAAGANYCLTGHWNGSRFEYAWVRPNAGQGDLQINPLPLRTDWFEVSTQADLTLTSARKLGEAARQISRLKAWLGLDSRGSTSYFPYHLALRNAGTGQTRQFGDTVYDGETYGLELLADLNAQLDRVQKQWIYVMVIDSWGKTQVVFPPVAQGNVQNRVPYDLADQNNVAAAPAEILLGGPSQSNFFTVTSPFGIDTYVLEPIPELSVLNSDGVRTRNRGAEENPLQELLQNTGDQMRGPEPGVPTDWSIQKVCIKSSPKPD